MIQLSCLLGIWLSVGAFLPPSMSPTQNGHAHNDYLHERPLLDALELGYGSIEVDVHLFKDELVVSHYSLGLKKKPFIQDLYFEPLRLWMSLYASEYLPPNPPLEIMIDFKTDGEAAYMRLEELVNAYPGLFEVFEAEKPNVAPVRLVISGNRPVELILNDPNRIAVLDGRIPDLGKGISSALMPRISTSYKSELSWAGKGEMPVSEQARFNELMELAKAEGKEFRFWAAPETLEWWSHCAHYENALVNIDDLEGFAQFCEKSEENEK